MAFTEFCCRSGGSNMNGGGDNTNGEPGTSPLYSATNGGWNSGTGVYTPASGNPSLSVTVGDWANVFTDGSTTPVFIGRVTAVSSTTITVSTTAKSGTAPTTAGSGISINVGGAWLGMNGAVNFPFGFVNGTTMQNASANIPRVNIKNDQTYNITATIVSSVTGPCWYQGYTTTFGDRGKYTVDGGNPGTSFIMFNTSGTGNAGLTLADFVFRNNGANGSGSSSGMTGISSLQVLLLRGVIHDMQGSGCAPGYAVECEVYACNKSNSSVQGPFTIPGSGGLYVRCLSHDNPGSNVNGFYSQQVEIATLLDCVSFNNGNCGFFATTPDHVSIVNCDFYNNANHGVQIAGVAGTYNANIENSNFVLNGGYGIDVTDAGNGIGLIRNCGFGTGTQANVSGTINTPSNCGVQISGSVNYPANVTPWSSPSTGNFSLVLPQAINAGVGDYTETGSSQSGTVAFPDIGAAAHGALTPVGQQIGMM